MAAKPASGEVQAPVLAAEIEQRIPVRLVPRVVDLTDKDQVVAAFVDRVSLAVERGERTTQDRRPPVGLDRPIQVAEPVQLARSEAVGIRLLSDLQHVDRELACSGKGIEVG